MVMSVIYETLYEYKHFGRTFPLRTRCTVLLQQKFEALILLCINTTWR